MGACRDCRHYMDLEAGVLISNRIKGCLLHARWTHDPISGTYKVEKLGDVHNLNDGGKCSDFESKPIRKWYQRKYRPSVRAYQPKEDEP